MAQPNNPRPGNNPGNVMKPTPRMLPTPSVNAGATTTNTTRVTTATVKGPVRPFLFDKSNYRVMLGGLLLILLGLFLMAGGKSADPHQFRYDEIFSFRRVTLAPVVMMIGFCLQIYAIMKRPQMAVVTTKETAAF